MGDKVSKAVIFWYFLLSFAYIFRLVTV